MADPSIDFALANLGAALQMLTNISLQSVAELIPNEGDDAENLLAEHCHDIVKALLFL